MECQSEQGEDEEHASGLDDWMQEDTPYLTCHLKAVGTPAHITTRRWSQFAHKGFSLG